MSVITRGEAAPAQRVRSAVRIGAVGVLVLLVLWGAGARALAGDDIRSDLVSDNEPTRFVPASSSECVLDARYLPRTADAVEAWYPGCRILLGRDSACLFHPEHLPRTPDAVEGWYRSCHIRW